MVKKNLFSKKFCLTQNVFTFGAAERTGSCYVCCQDTKCTMNLHVPAFAQFKTLYCYSLACSVWPVGGNNAFAVCYFQQQINKCLVLWWGSKMVFVGMNQNKSQCVYSWRDVWPAQYFGSVICFHILFGKQWHREIGFLDTDLLLVITIHSCYVS